MAWLLIFPTLGALVSLKFTDPGFLADTAWLNPDGRASPGG